MLRLPGLIDVHVHVRDPGQTHKEDWDSCSAAALAGGITTIFGMPNTAPETVDQPSLELCLEHAKSLARCDYAQYVGATTTNSDAAPSLANAVAGLKMYLDPTFNDLRLVAIEDWMAHFERWPKDLPIAVHAEERTMGTALLLAHLFERKLHVCHVARRDEMLMVAKAKERGLDVTCEVAPHHLVLSTEELATIGPGRCEVRPRIATPDDRASLWEMIDYIDCFATDHAPHLLSEKDSENPPPGYPGLETALPLLLTAVHEGKIELDDIVARYHTNPARIFAVPEAPETWIEIDPDAQWKVGDRPLHTRCQWTPFHGTPVRGRVVKTMLHGRVAFHDDVVLAPPGNGRPVRAPAIVTEM